MMPKKKQVTFQSTVPGKFIPREDFTSATGFQSGTNTNRFNSKMVELLTSSESSAAAALASTTSKPINDENESIANATESHQNDLITPNSSETATIKQSHVHSKLFHRRIATMLETLRGRNNSITATSHQPPPKVLPSYIESKSQPITFGQLRQATTSSGSQQMHNATLVEEVVSPRVLSARSCTDVASINKISDKQSYSTNVTMFIDGTRSDLKSASSSASINKSSSKHQVHKERLYYSPSLEHLLEQHNVVPRMRQQIEELKLEDQPQSQQLQSKPPLTVDEILATYYSKANVPANIEIQPQRSTNYNDNMNFFAHPVSVAWNTSQTNQLFVSSSSTNSPPPPPPPLPPAPVPPHIPPFLLNELNRNRPPPPSYAFSIAKSHQTLPSGASNTGQHIIRPPAPSLISEQVYAESPAIQHLVSINPPLNLPTTLSSIPTNSPIRSPPPRYQLPTSTIERSHSALSSMNRPNYFQINPPQAGFDREFSRLLYGKNGEKYRNRQQKRKALSDPVKKSVEEAGRSIEKHHRRLITHVNKNDTVNEEEENSHEPIHIKKTEQNLSPQKRFTIQTQLMANNRELAKKPIVPPNPLLKRQIPPFLRVYSQEASTTNTVLQWNLLSLSELESFDGMMTKLYRDENFDRVQLYENYRVLLTSMLELKKLLDRVHCDENDDDDDNDNDDHAITTTAL